MQFSDMKKMIEILSLSYLEKAAEDFIDITRGHHKFAFYGSLGSGKTTFIKEICKKMGAMEPLSSPSFALINEYKTVNGLLLYHFDLFRINTIDEMFDLGYEEYFFDEHHVFVEWPEKAEILIPEFFIKVNLKVVDQNKRIVVIDL
jgi:tRNA threonylcarbamoyladenosine biosynthesis protein TsaE